MEKINIAELLKDCPRGMELDCTMFDNVTFFGISNGQTIVAIRGTVNHKLYLDKYGCPSEHPKEDLKCVIFPKGKTTWEGFVPPCKFRDGDILANDRGSICIYKGPVFYNKNLADYYCGYRAENHAFVYKKFKENHFGDINKCRIATEEEKKKLFDAIKENGYKWNAETKTLEKLIEPEFNIGDWIIRNNKYTGIPVKVIEFNGYYSCELNGEVVNLTLNDVHNNFHLWTIQDAQDGDVLAAHECLVLFKKLDGLNIKCYCTYHFMGHQSFYVDTLQNKDAFHPASKEQCDRLFSKIKEMGYKWNEETKTLENLFPYKIGTKVWVKSDKAHEYIHTIVGISRNSLGNLEYEVKEEKTGIVVHYPKDLLIPNTTKEVKFKVGATVRNKNNHNIVFTITSIEEDSYVCGAKAAFWFDDQDEYELIPNKFDITTLKPFDSRVLVRDFNSGKWKASFWGFLTDDMGSLKYDTTRGCYNQCIPFERNEHLLGTTNDCDEFYKTWE